MEIRIQSFHSNVSMNTGIIWDASTNILWTEVSGKKYNCQNPRPLTMSADTRAHEQYENQESLQVVSETARLWEHLSTKFVLQEELIVCDWMTRERMLNFRCRNSEITDCRIPLKCLNISDVVSVPWSLHPFPAQGDPKPHCDHTTVSRLS